MYNEFPENERKQKNVCIAYKDYIQYMVNKDPFIYTDFVEDTYSMISMLNRELREEAYPHIANNRTLPSSHHQQQRK